MIQLQSNPSAAGQDEKPNLRQLLSQRLLAAPATRGSIRSDRDLNPDWSADLAPADMREAAVLVPIIERQSETTILFTKRTDHLSKHAGQIAFPGGRLDQTDPGPVEGALRETEEEVGIPSAHVDVVGFLDPYETGTGYRIQPVVGLVAPGFTVTINPYEVAEVFEVPFSFLMDQQNHRQHKVMWQGKHREYYAMPYDDYYIWGATAGMLKALYDRLSDAMNPPCPPPGRSR